MIFPPGPLVVPSLLSADFTQLGDDVRRLGTIGAPVLHLDVMDGMFVPNISFGPMVVRAVNKITDIFLDVHLMIMDPDRYLQAFCDAGADNLTVHVEACTDIAATLQRIKALGMKAGVSLNPETPVEALVPALPHADLVLVMSVHPGFGGQKFIPDSLTKLQQLRSMIDTAGTSAILEVDGGIDPDTIRSAADAGAQYLVAGNAVFHGRKLEDNFHHLKTILTS